MTGEAAMNRLPSMLAVLVVGAVIAGLTRSVILTASVLAPGLLSAARDPRPWNEVGRDFLAHAAWGVVVYLCLRVVWGYRLP